MPNGGRDIRTHEAHLARRLGRLFRIERSGRLQQRGADVTARLQVRRGELIAALMRTEATRRQLRLATTPALHQALAALWHETGAMHRVADRRLQQSRSELLLARGEGIPSGIRGTLAGRLLGQV
jgi:hypothetical protein